MGHLVDVVMQGDVGRAITVDMGFDLGGYDTFTIRAQKPSGAVQEWAAAKIDTPDNETLSYTTVAGDLDEVGIYRLFPIASAGAGEQISKSPFSIYVKELPEVVP